MKKIFESWQEKLKLHPKWSSICDDYRSCKQFFEKLYSSGLAARFKVRTAPRNVSVQSPATSSPPKKFATNLSQIRDLIDDKLIADRVIVELSDDISSLAATVKTTAIRALRDCLLFNHNKDKSRSNGITKEAFLNWTGSFSSAANRTQSGLRASASALSKLLKELMQRQAIAFFDLENYGRAEYVVWSSIVEDERLCSELESALLWHQETCSPSSFARRRRALVSFFKHLYRHGSVVDLGDEKLISQQWRDWRQLHYQNSLDISTDSLPSSKNDDYAAARILMKLLMARGIIPRFEMPPRIRSLDKAREVLSTSINHLGFSNLRPESEERNHLWHPKNAFISDSEFLDLFRSDLREVVGAIVGAAIKDINSAIDDFELGRKYIDECDIDYLSRVLANGTSSIDYEAIIDAGISIFSPQHPDGLKNLVGWTYHKNSGRIYSRAFKGEHWAMEHGGYDKIRRHLGLTFDVALVFAIVIVYELCVNVDSLRKVVVPHGYAAQLFKPTDVPGVNYFSWDKPRANAFLRKLVFEEDDKKINAFRCIKEAYRFTESFRPYTDSDSLWLLWAHSGSFGPKAMSDSAWKKAFHRFIDRHPTLHRFRDRAPNLAKLRASVEILEWFDTGGDIEAAAKKLGNSTAVAIKSYVPKVIQDLLYARQIRRWQNLILVEAVNDKSLAELATGFTCEELDRFMGEMVGEGNLKDSACGHHANCEDEAKKDSSEKFIFLLSSDNVAMLTIFCEYFLSIEAVDSINQRKIVVGGFSIAEWLDLSALLKINLSDSSDHTHRGLYHNGIKLAKKNKQKIKFPDFMAEFR